MAILIGITNESAHGAFHGAEGLEGFSVDSTRMTIIKEGTQSDLEAYVKQAREEAKEAQKKLNELYDEYGPYRHATSGEFNKLEEKYIKKRYISQFNKLIIVEGIVL